MDCDNIPRASTIESVEDSANNNPLRTSTPCENDAALNTIEEDSVWRTSCPG
eukprot:m.94113 g.94113  ORF g.94113 m.94113 type:complete len:52 (+) comp12208_c0_seq2:889-1044(+)